MSIMGISPTGDDDWWHWWHCVIGKYNTRWTYGGSTQPLAIAWITQENKKLIKSTNLNAFLWRHVHWETKPSRIHIAHFALHLHFALHTENCTLYAPLSTLCTLHSTSNSTLYTLRSTLYTALRSIVLNDHSNTARKHTCSYDSYRCFLWSRSQTIANLAIIIKPWFVG